MCFFLKFIIIIIIVVCLVSWALKQTTWDLEQSSKCRPRNTVGTMETTSCLFTLFFLIMEMRPIGRKEPLLSKNTIHAFPKRKDLEIKHNGPDNIFL